MGVSAVYVSFIRAYTVK